MLKTCFKCGVNFPATTVHFYPFKKNKDGLSGKCRECLKAYAMSRYEYVKPEDKKPILNKIPFKLITRPNCPEEKAKNLEWQRLYYHQRMSEPEFREKKLAQSRKAAKHARETKNDIVNAKRKAKRNENPSQTKAMSARYYNKVKDDPKFRAKRSKQHKTYYQEADEGRYEGMVARVHKRRAKVLGADGSYTKNDIKRLFVAQSYKCLYCGSCIFVRRWQLEHLIPISKGGTNWPHNLGIACRACNASKGSKMPWEFMPDKFSPPAQQAAD